MDRGAWQATVHGVGLQRVRHDLATEQQLLLREYSKEIQLLYLIGDTAR